MIDLSKAQDVEAGDGTTSVVVLAGGLLAAAQELLEKGIHPSVISNSLMLMQRQAAVFLKQIAIPIDLTDRKSLEESAITSLNSKVISANSDLLAPLAVDAIFKVIEPATATNVDLNMIKVVGKLGGTLEDTELVDGLVFAHGAVHAAGGPGQITDAKIGLIQYQLSAPKTNMENTVVVEDYAQIDRILKEERAYIQKLLKPIIKSGCNVLLIQKSILRDAVSDIALHYLATRKIMVIKDIERSEVEFISQSLGLQPVADPDSFDATKLGSAKLVAEQSTPSGKIIKVTGVKNPGKTVSILVRGSNRLVIDEAVRSLHDALCVIRCLVKQKFLLPGGGAPEMALSVLLSKWADTLSDVNGYCIKSFAKALQTTPSTLAENAGMHPVTIVSELRKAHAAGEHYSGINVRKNKITDIREENVLQPMLVSLSAVSLAIETTRMILKIDDIVGVR